MFRPAGAGGAPTTTTPAGTTPVVENLSLPTADTEVSFAFPAGTVAWELQCRTGGLAKFAFSAGQSGIEYVTLWPGSVFQATHAPSSSLVLYVQSPKSGQVLELLYWTV